MLGDDQLEAGNVLLSELQQQFEQPTNRTEVCVSLCPLHRAVRVLIDLHRWEVDLGRLVDQ